MGLLSTLDPCPLRPASRAPSRQRLGLLAAVLLAALPWIGCTGESTIPDVDVAAAGATDSEARSPQTDCTFAHPAFAEVDASSGFDFVHFNGMTGRYFFHEMVGGGAALFDADGDGDLDVFVTQGELQGTDLPGDDITLDDAIFQPRYPLPLTDRLYRNDSEPGSGSPLRFTDVTEGSGLGSGYGMGVATGDVNGDGLADLYVTRFRSNQLLISRGDGTFRDATAEAGVDDPRWSVSATFADLDGDGRLDLYVANYVEYALETHKRCRSESGADDYCGPHTYPPAADSLFVNRTTSPDQVRFEDVSRSAGVAAAPGPSLGVIAAELDGDDRIDLYVANDGAANQLWLRAEDDSPERVRLRDAALLSGLAFNRDGVPEAGMGVDAADPDGDGDLDLFLSHLALETNTLYQNLGGGQFDDVTQNAGLGAPSFDVTGFGTVYFDLDNDGRLDLMVANGAVKVLPDLVRRGDPYPLHQPNLLFRNLGTGSDGAPRFADVTACGGSPFERSEVSRGVAVGDVDDDGDQDLLVINNAGPARLLRNVAADGTPWVGFRTVDEAGNVVLGARVELRVPTPAGEHTVLRVSRTGGGYASAHDPRILFGLAGVAADGPMTARVAWPADRRSSVRSETFDVTETGRYLTLRRGQGRRAGG